MIFRAIPVGIAVALLALGGAAMADVPKPFPKFEAKRLKAPGAQVAARPQIGNRIKVQIDPDEQAALLAARPKTQPQDDPQEVPEAEPGRYGWFWDQISPGFDGSGPGRLGPALRALAGERAVAAPRLQTLQDIARSQGVPILKSTLGTKVSPALVLAVIAVESAGRADAVSHAGAAGLMQLMPATAERFGVTDRLVAEDNIRGGVKYLDWLMGEFGADPMLVLAGYNAGEGAVKKHGGVPPYSETRDYVPKVLAAFRMASALCQTPPELLSDGCVFRALN